MFVSTVHRPAFSGRYMLPGNTTITPKSVALIKQVIHQIEPPYKEQAKPNASNFLGAMTKIKNLLFANYLPVREFQQIQVKWYQPKRYYTRLGSTWKPNEATLILTGHDAKIFQRVQGETPAQKLKNYLLLENIKLNPKYFSAMELDPKSDDRVTINNQSYKLQAIKTNPHSQQLIPSEKS
jgi:hypothetical protein